MNTDESPFKAIIDAQKEQREGHSPETPKPACFASIGEGMPKEIDMIRALEEGSYATISSMSRVRNLMLAAFAKQLQQSNNEGLLTDLLKEREEARADYAEAAAKLAKANAELELLREALRSAAAVIGQKIEGQLLHAYMEYQFPATQGHIPLRKFYQSLGSELVNIAAVLPPPAPTAEEVSRADFEEWQSLKTST